MTIPSNILVGAKNNETSKLNSTKSSNQSLPIIPSQIHRNNISITNYLSPTNSAFIQRQNRVCHAPHSNEGPTISQQKNQQLLSSFLKLHYLLGNRSPTTNENYFSQYAIKKGSTKKDRKNRHLATNNKSTNPNDNDSISSNSSEDLPPLIPRSCNDSISTSPSTHQSVPSLRIRGGWSTDEDSSNSTNVLNYDESESDDDSSPIPEEIIINDCEDERFLIHFTIII